MKKVYIDDVGSGFPLVLVHGYLGSSKMWCNQINYFSKFCRVISPALPGQNNDVDHIGFDVKDIFIFDEDGNRVRS